MTDPEQAALAALVAWAKSKSTRLKADHARLSRTEIDLLVAAQALIAERAAAVGR